MVHGLLTCLAVDLLLRAELGLEPGTTQIIPLIIGDPEAAVAASERALADGVFAQAIRPPTVPAGTSRIRLAVMATHTEDQLRHAAAVLQFSELGAKMT